MSGETARIAGNGWGGVDSGTGSSMYIETGPVVVEDNHGNGVSVNGSSALRANELIVPNNDGDGISIGDLSTLNSGAIHAVDNGGWGIFCGGPPAVAVFGGQIDYDEAPITSGNGAGDTNCPAP